MTGTIEREYLQMLLDEQVGICRQCRAKDDFEHEQQHETVVRTLVEIMNHVFHADLRYDNCEIEIVSADEFYKRVGRE